MFVAKLQSILVTMIIFENTKCVLIRIQHNNNDMIDVTMDMHLLQKIQEAQVHHPNSSVAQILPLGEKRKNLRKIRKNLHTICVFEKNNTR